MPRINFEWSCLAVLFFPLLLDFAAGKIQLSHYKATKELGANFMVTCRDDAGRFVSWSGPKGALGTKTHPGVEVSSYGTSLVFMSISKEDSGAYACKAGQESAQFHLTVEVPLTFMDTPPEQVGKEGNDVTLRCEVQGGDKSVLIWTSEGKELQPPKYQQMGDGLLIRNVTKTDSKIYTCRAMQLSTGNIRDQNITLKVEHKPVSRHPHLWKQVDQAWGFIGGDVNLTCEVEANPAPKFEWYRKNHPLILKDQVIYEPHRAILQLHINNSQFFGEYKCRASNKLGKLEKLIMLQEGVQPDPPELLLLREAHGSSLDLDIQGPNITNRTIALGMKPVGYRVQFKALLDDVQWDRANTVDFLERNETSYTITELTKDTSYEIRVATRNVAGISDYTNSIILKTLKSSARSILFSSSFLLYASMCTSGLASLL